MGWFNYLKTNGFFAPEANPQPVKSKHGYSSPRWEALDYLEMIAEKIKNGESPEFINELIDIIFDVSKHPVDNYISWYRLISILSKIPNDRIPLTLLAYQNVWVSSRFNTGLQTTEIAETLLPKFLTGEPNDLVKAKSIFEHLFVLYNFKTETSQDSRTYQSPYDLGNLHRAFVELNGFKPVFGHFGAHALLYVANQLNVLLRDHHRHFDIISNDQKFHFSTIPVFNDLKLFLKNAKEEVINEEIIKDYFGQTSDAIQKYLTEYFEKHKVTGTDVTTTLEQLMFTLQNDLESLMGFYGIEDLEEEAESGYAELHTFAYILVEGLSALAEISSDQLTPILNELAINQRYQLPFFKRLLIHVIGKNWILLKQTFWLMSGKLDANRIFSSYPLYKELYQMLEKVANELDDDDTAKLKNMLAQGPLGDRYSDDGPINWQHRWLQALKENPSFRLDFDKISNPALPLKDYGREGKVMVRVGTTSPLNAQELTALPQDELINLLNTFHDRDRFDGPTGEGLGQKLQEAIKETPQHFADLLQKLGTPNYSYAYRIFWGFYEALKVNHSFNWKQVLAFTIAYIQHPDFIADKLHSQDDMRTSRDIVAGQIAYLISEGTRNEMLGFDKTDLQQATKIIEILATSLSKSERIPNEPTPDFVMSSLNTTQGKVLRAVLDCSLQTARDANAPLTGRNWAPNLKTAFAAKLQPEILDGYTLQGMYLSQFMFLDDAWLKNEIIEHEKLAKLPWTAFMAGVAFGKPISGEYYAIMQPHYQRALDENIIDLHYQQGLLRHFVAFYFWDYEVNYKNTFLYKLIDRYPVQYAHSLVQFLNTQAKSIYDLEGDEHLRLTSKLTQIWEHLLQLFSGASNDDDREPLKGIVRFITAFQALDARTAQVLKETLNVDLTHGRGDFIIKQLIRLNKTSGSIKQIANLSQDLNYNTFYHIDQLKSLIIILYENGEKEAANNIVNKLVILGNHQFKQLYMENNP